MAPEPDDVTLMLRYRAGNLAAFDALYERHKGPLFRYCLRQCRNADLAADLFQEIWSRLVRARHDYHPTARFPTYLYRIAHNCLVDHYRRQARVLPLADPADGEAPDPPDDAPGPEALAAQAETARWFRAALGQLPDEQREAFLLHEEAELTLAEIAAITGANEETVKSRLRYALKKLRRALDGGDGEP